MFSVLVHHDGTAWETDQLMRFENGRFGEYSDTTVTAASATSEFLRSLEATPAFLIYETGAPGESVATVRYGTLHNVKVSGSHVTFRFEYLGTFARRVVERFASRLGIHALEFNRTHWAIKDGDIPSAMLSELKATYEVVLSFAGEDRIYVERVAEDLRSHGVRVFYDRFAESDLWGKDLVEHFEAIYGGAGQYCVLFASHHYAAKVWPKVERRAAVARAINENREYILPVRFDDTEIPGIPSTVAYFDGSQKSTAELSDWILKKLGRGKSEVPAYRGDDTLAQSLHIDWLPAERGFAHPFQLRNGANLLFRVKIRNTSDEHFEWAEVQLVDLNPPHLSCVPVRLLPMNATDQTGVFTLPPRGGSHFIDVVQQNSARPENLRFWHLAPNIDQHVPAVPYELTLTVFTNKTNASRKFVIVREGSGWTMNAVGPGFTH